MKKILDWISKTFNVTSNVASYIFYGVLAFIIILLLIIIIAVVMKCNKKKEITSEEPVKEVKQEKAKPAKVVKEEKEATPSEPIKETKAAPKTTTTRKVTKKEPVKKTLGKYLVSKEGDKFRYRLNASNGETLVVSELYASSESCKNGINTIKANVSDSNIDVVEDKHGLFSFRVMSNQGRCIATSANYSSKASALSAIESFKNFVNTDRIEVDTTTTKQNFTTFHEEISLEDSGKFKITQVDGEFIYQLFANNGQVIATSQAYKTLVTCKKALETFRELVYTEDFLIYEDKNKNYQFKLYNKQHRLVLAGEVYDDKTRVISAIKSIKRFAKLAQVSVEQNND